jgi:hypothetical protein
MTYMLKTICSSIILIIIVAIITPTAVSDSITVGLNKGNWIEYDVEISRNQTNDSEIMIPPDHNISWARIDVTEVVGGIITLSIQTRFSNGTILSGNTFLNLETGTLGDDFIIPANLTQGNLFFDKYQGNITITSVQIQTVAGAERVVISGATNETKFYWDQLTGVLINAESKFPGYSLITRANITNLWSTQSVSASPEKTPIGIDTILIYVLLVIGLIFLVIAILFLKLHKMVLRWKIRKYNNS